MQNNDFLDVFKMMLILMVLAIHAQLSTGLAIMGIDPIPLIFRMAVPLFFIMSSYFFFKKCARNDKDARNAFLRKYVKRNVSLYLFWFVVLLPITLYVRWEWWFGGSFVRGAAVFLENLFLGGTFCASWFLMALIIGVPIVAMLNYKAKIPNQVLLVVGIALYGVAVYCSSYASLVESAYPSLNGCAVYRGVRLQTPNSIAAAFGWIVIGKMVAESSLRPVSISMKAKCALLILCLALYLGEGVLAKHLVGGGGANDCYLFLIPVCTVAFLIVKDLDIKIDHAREFRSVSTVFYVLHASAFVIIDLVLAKFCICDSAHLIKFSCGCIVCLIAFCGLKYLSNCRGLSWVKCSF